MVTYKFKFIDSKVPVIKGKNVITDSNVGGIKNTYNIYLVHWLWPRYIGTKTFLRPYQSVWDAKKNRLPAPYWGKGPLLNLWLILSNDFNNIKDVKVLLPEGDTSHHCIKIYNIDFLSQLLNKNLKSNQSFYQSKFKKL